MDMARISLSGSETIDISFLTFIGHVTFNQDVTTNTLVNGVDLQWVQEFQDVITADVEAKTEEVAWILHQQCLEIDRLQTLFHCKILVAQDSIHLGPYAQKS